MADRDLGQAPAGEASARSAWLTGAAFALVLGAAALAMRGFTVDDALISVQYARHWSQGAGYALSLHGAPTDGVTPLPWPLILLPLAHADALTVLGRAQTLGNVSWSVAAFVLGTTLARERVTLLGRALALCVLACSLPVAAHASSGMETALAMSLATLAVSTFRRPFASTALASLTAALRPEMLPWAVAWAFGRSVGAHENRPTVAIHASLAAAPMLAVSVTRTLLFGHPYPLAVMAKPSDLDHGVTYAVVGLVVCAVPLACVAPRALSRSRGSALAAALAFVVHACVVALVGGDWMPYARLLAPVVPSLALAFACSARTSAAWSLLGRAGVAIAVGAYFWAVAAPKGMGVRRDRDALVRAAEPVLGACTNVAAVDIGWVSAATDANVTDLAGLTDPAIAALPGGHTSKRVDAGMLLDRRVDCAVFYVEGGFETAALARPQDIVYGHQVSDRLAQSPLFQGHFTPVAKLPLGTGDRGYVVFRAE